MKRVGKRKFRWDDVASGEQRCEGNYVKALQRDNYQCAICGSDFYIVVHHLDGNNNNHIDNLLTVCKRHHAELHGQTLTIKNPRVDLILELRKQRKTFEEVGDYLGISRQRVHQIIKKIS